MTLFTKVPAADGLPADAPRGKEAERILAAELLSSLRAMQATMTEFVERLGGRIINHVLEIRTRAFDTNATPIQLSYGTVIGALMVRAPAHAVTIATGPAAAGSAAPTAGLGVWTVPANTVETVPIGAREVTLYGTANDVVQYVALTSGPIAVAG